jgi:exopolyphosphatase / guanosine-5'-triphosphate,3'-diphosphate pyrophosphatase
MRIAVLDIGSNSTRLLLADVQDSTVTDELERESVVTRLGAGVDADGQLREDAMERVYTALGGFAEKIAPHGADKRVAVLTSAVRDAANGEDFASTVRERFGFVPHVLAGDEEARLTFLGATSERNPDDDTPTVVIDIGGGSTEIVIGTGREAEFHVSNQAGVVRQTERHIHSDPPADDELAKLRDDVAEILREGVPEDHRRAVKHAIAVAGTATSLAAIAQRLEPYDAEKVHGYELTRERCAEILKQLASVPLEERRQTPGLNPDRAPTIVAGVEILLAVLELFGLDRVEVSEHDILRGAALGLDP